MIGVVLTAAPYRALCDETIAELAGVELYLVRRCVDVLGSLLYRDEAADRGIRVRHLSIYDFFINHRGDYQVNVQYEDVQLGVACLKMMITQLRFNICKLEDSRLANDDIKDLPSRIKENISDALQYSCLHWSNHLCSPPDNGDQRALVLSNLKEFFEGLYTLFWVEVLSLMGMVPTGAPSLRRVTSWVRVSKSPAFSYFSFQDDSIFATGCRFNSPRKDSGYLSFHHHVPHPHLLQHSTYVYFNAAIPALTVTFIKDLHQRIYWGHQVANRERIVMASAANGMDWTR